MRVGWRSLFRLILHCLYTCFHQFLHQRHWYWSTHWEANNGFRCGITCKFLPVFLYDWRAYMYAYVWFLEAEPRKHSVIIKSCIGISGHLEIIGAFSGARRCRPYGRSDLRQIALRLFWTSCYVFIYFTTFAFCHGCLLPLSWRFIIVIDCDDFTGNSRQHLFSPLSQAKMGVWTIVVSRPPALSGLRLSYLLVQLRGGAFQFRS